VLNKQLGLSCGKIVLLLQHPCSSSTNC
jgi:hypothetical protein